MSAIAIAVDAARDAGHRRHTDAREAYTRAWNQAFGAASYVIETADAQQLADLVNDADAHALVNAIVASVRDADVSNSNQIPRSIRDAWGALHDAICCDIADRVVPR